MKKTLLAILMLAFGISGQVLAVGNGQSQNSNKPAQTGNETNVAQTGNQVGTKEQNKVVNQGESTQVQTQEENAVKTKDKAKDESKVAKGKAEEHRSAVATFVQSLLGVADREGGIGQEVRTIANQQNDSKDRAADIIYAVENRNKVKTFFIGTSYKNLGELRSQMVQTRNQIDQLKRLAEKATNEADKTELQNQIQTLEQEQIKINDFITQNESQFSLFGWAVKLFRN